MSGAVTWARGWLAALVAVCLLVPPVPSSAAPRPRPLRIEVPSNRADLISGGNALVSIALPKGVDVDDVSLDLNGRDVTTLFALRSDSRFAGVLSGLKVGANTLSARLPDGSGARLSITNHPIGGPVFAGEQVKPWICATEENGLGPALDEQCNTPTIYEFFYKSNESGEFEPYDSENPPPESDVATTTTDEGHTVPYIVRRERGVIDRGIYDIAVLFDPSDPWDPWEPQEAWNGKLHWPFGGSCQPYHAQNPPGGRPDIGGGDEGGVLDDNALSRGFAVASSGFSVLGNNCNTVVSAEALMMIKEHFIETYGPVRYTFGRGGSGGSIQQIQIAGAYPGLLDGILPQATFADIATTATENFDCRLLVRYFNVVSPHLGWTPAAKLAIEGGGFFTTCEAWISAYGFPAMLGDPTLGCITPLLTYLETDYTGILRSQSEPDWVYDADTNPDGVRCTIYDYMSAIFGRRSEDGPARRPYDNVGVQYGLKAVEAGVILPEQFVDLNEKIGGIDIDYGFQSTRSEADPGSLAATYRSGQVTDGRQLAKVPIIDGSYAIPHGDIHTAFHSWELRERIAATNGSAENHVIRQAGGGRPAFDVMDEWLDNIEADPKPGPLSEKIVRNKPADLVDSGSYIGTDPRIAAGAPLSDDILRCMLKPLDRADYSATFTDDQWARLQAAFPDGVCDWTRPGIDQQATIPWATYRYGTGPRPLGKRPVSIPIPSRLPAR